ncbi:MAG: TonB-dependent receptor plug domain-containing protein [Flavobacteriia bacterium]|nr:TonB-dependent receptor plug domain-containing protein [Flavobacteriia bacterium]
MKKIIDLNINQNYSVELPPKSLNLKEVVVKAKKGENIESTKIGQIELNIEQIKMLPAFMGEVDIIKTIQLLPGVSSASEGGQGFYVRGGGPDQNLVLLDEALVYNASHLFGFFSVFNSDAVKTVNLIKGGIPANFGGRMSSVLEVGMVEGNNKEFKYKGGLGAISSRLAVEGPIVKDKGSFMISARRTYIDLIMKAAIPKNSSFYGSGYYFHDYNLKLNYRLSKRDKLFFSAYYGKDQFSFGNSKNDLMIKMPWGNAILATRWNHIFSPKLFCNITASMTDYMFKFISEQDIFQFELKSGIRDYGGKIDFTYFWNTRNKIKWGADYVFHTFIPSSVSAKQNETVFDTGTAQSLKSHESALYLLDEVDVNDAIKLNIGLRYNFYHFTGPFTRYYPSLINGLDSTKTFKKNEIIQFYQGLEPRISGRFSLGKNSSIKAGYTYNYQYIHLASLSAVSMPTDIWYPSTELVKPQKGWQASIGYFHNFLDDVFETSIELYYKKMFNLLEFKQGALPQDNVKDNTDNLLVSGEGYSAGIELFIKKNIGDFTGWIGYTLSKTERYFPLIQEDPFPAKYDRRHDLSIVSSYKINTRLVFSLTFVYASGNTLTLPTAWYVHEQDLVFHYGSRNSTRMAPYHRLDLSLTWYGKEFKNKINKTNGETEKIKKKVKSNWNFSIYNVYNRANPYFIYIDNDGELLKGDFKITAKQVSLFPILPSITWNFEF